MTEPLIHTVLLMTIPLLGATVGLFLWRKPKDLKSWLLLVAASSLITIGWTSGTLPAQSGDLFLLLLLPLMAFVTLLGQPIHVSNAAPWLLTILFLGVGLGALATDSSSSLVCFLLCLGLVGLILFHYRHQGGSDVRWGIGMAVLGMLSILIALISAPPVSTLAVVIACAVALPLVPFHKTYITSLTGLPGNLPAFLALLLPIVGFHALLTRLPQFPIALSQTITILALLGMLYGSLKALAQFRAASVAAYGGLVFQSILWWYLAAIHASTPSIVVYLSAVGVATSGLLLAWYMLRARYGEIGLQALSGLAQPMPKFAVAFSLLALAALGMPPFGVFSGFIGLLLVPSFMWSGGLIVVIIVWLTASWYVFALMQELLFGGVRMVRRHEDLRQYELASLVIVLVLLVILGVMPSRFFDIGAISALQASLTESLTWNE